MVSICWSDIWRDTEHLSSDVFNYCYLKSCCVTKPLWYYHVKIKWMLKAVFLPKYSELIVKGITFKRTERLLSMFPPWSNDPWRLSTLGHWHMKELLLFLRVGQQLSTTVYLSYGFFCKLVYGYRFQSPKFLCFWKLPSPEQSFLWGVN